MKGVALLVKSSSTKMQLRPVLNDFRLKLSIASLKMSVNAFKYDELIVSSPVKTREGLSYLPSHPYNNTINIGLETLQ